MNGERPKGGRRPEDFPEARARDRAVLEYVRDDRYGLPHLRNKATRNMIAYDLDEDNPRLISRSLERLKRRGLVRHVAKGNEGHGYWVAVRDGETTEEGGQER